MIDQNYRNHTRILKLWHLILPLAMLAVMGGSIAYFVNAQGDQMYVGALLIIISLIIPVIWGYARKFALTAQDRAIRAEENFRHYLLTGKPHHPDLRLGQIIALRFASDEEMPALAKKAVEQQLSPKQIKQAIFKWKGDYRRV